MKNFLTRYLPESLAKQIILFARQFKKQIRFLKRLYRFGSKPFFKKITINSTQFYIQLWPLKNACVDETIALTGVWEKTVSEQLTRYIKPGNTFVDIGANVGYHSLFVASLLNGTGSVHAFEPIPHLCKQINSSIKKNVFSNVHIYQIGLGEKDLEIPLYIRDENMGGSSIFEFPELNLVKPSSTTEINIKSLDEVIKEEPKIDLIKIDVEGYEFEVLRGARKTLKKYHPVIFLEFSPIFYKSDYKSKATEFVSYLKDFGYVFLDMNGQNLNLDSWLAQITNPGQIDIICVHKNTNA